MAASNYEITFSNYAERETLCIIGERIPGACQKTDWLTEQLGRSSAHFLDYGEVKVPNNPAESALLPFVVELAVFLYPKEADSSAIPLM